MQNCAMCETHTHCQMAEPGYKLWLSNKQPYAESTACADEFDCCDAGVVVLDQTQNTCASDTTPPPTTPTCPANCSDCDENGICRECNDKFYQNPNGMGCLACEANCNDCNQIDGECLDCADGFTNDVADNKLCVAIECPSTSEFEHCNACELTEDGQHECVDCAVGFRTNVDMTCSACPANCDDCSFDQCNACASGFERHPLDLNTCVDLTCPATAAFAQCNICELNATGAHFCKNCDGDFVVDGETGLCVAVPADDDTSTCDIRGCGSCNAANDSCTQCLPGFTAVCSASGHTVMCEEQPAQCSTIFNHCDTCKYDNDTFLCEACDEGYEKDEAGQCSQCAHGYTRDEVSGLCKSACGDISMFILRDA